MWSRDGIGLRLGLVRWVPWVLALAGLTGCRVLHSGLFEEAGVQEAGNPSPATDTSAPVEAQPALDMGEPPGVTAAPDIVGCSDGTREGFRHLVDWPNIAGCAGAFNQPGVLGSPDVQPACGLRAGDSNSNREGIDCSIADLCSANWHVCRDGGDVAKHSPTGDCEGCVPAGEPRFFLVASGASSMGLCSPDPLNANDLHGCGGLGQPESQACAPLSRRMGFADCLATNGVWSCGDESDSLQEAKVVVKRGTTLGGVLCCKD